MTPFQVDTGADRTVVTWDIFDQLGLPFQPSSQPIEGVGGVADSVDARVEIRFNRHDGSQASFTVICIVVTEQSTVEMSLLGRDITDLFALIVDGPDHAVFMVKPASRLPDHIHLTTGSRMAPLRGESALVARWDRCACYS